MTDWNVAPGAARLVVVDGHYVLDGALHLELERYEMTEVESVACRSEAEIRDALVKRGAFEARAAEVAKKLWNETAPFLASG
jgi:hypothetical protein